MARKKTNKFFGVFKIFFSSIKTYFLYLDQTSKALAFPIFGQVISVALIFTFTYFFNTNIDDIKNSLPIFENISNIWLTFFIILFPLFLIFIKAFYKYLVAFSSLNLLFYTVSNKKNVKKIDFKENDNIVKRHFFKYIILLTLVTLILTIPPLIFIAPLTGIFLCLTFQVFVFESDISAFSCISRSTGLIKSNFIPTIILLLLCILTTYMFLPSLFIWACEKISLYYFLMNNCEKLISLIQLDYLTNISIPVISDIIKDILSPTALSRHITEGTLSFIILGFTLPFRCCCFTELYKLYDSEKIKEFSKESDEIIKRAGK